jgi:FkbM family methyltransferase
MPLHSQLHEFAKRVVRKVTFGDRELFHACDLLFRNVESGSLVVNIPELQGAFEIGSAANILRHVLVKSHYEPELADVIRRRINPDKDAIDVGANIGLLTVFMTRLLSPAGRILSIEPTPGASRFLRGNLVRNQCEDRVIVFEGVAASSPGQYVLNCIPGKEEYSSLFRIVHPSAEKERPGQISVPGETVDNLCERFALKPGLIKIDTEGAEEQVLAGAQKTLDGHRPVLICESFPTEMLVAAGGVPGAAESLLQQHGYTVMTSGCPPFTIVALPNERSV